MQVFVKSLAGNTLALNVNQQSSVADVKAMVEAREGIPSGNQCLSFGGKSLVSGGLLDFGVQDNSTLHLNAELLGGGKKRKKKTYTTPKKIKHKRKKVKMAILKFYKVDDAGKITRLRRECPTATCGAGVFMAWHSDRQYCGKCHLTYVFKKLVFLVYSNPVNDANVYLTLYHSTPIAHAEAGETILALQHYSGI